MRVGALVIGQTPRPDLSSLVGDGVALVVRGALDLPGSLPIEAPACPVFPLVTRLADGTPVVADEPWLAPRLQQQIGLLEADGVSAIILLCAGPFLSLTSTLPLVHPFRLGVELLRAAGLHRILALVPIPAQRLPSEQKWTAAGFQVTSAVFPSDESELPTFVQLQTAHVDAVVFDYVGFSRSAISSVRAVIRVPVLDLGHLAAATLRSLST
jgi:protein AroM